MSPQSQEWRSDRPAARSRRTSAGRRRALGVAASLVSHLLVLMLALSVPASAPKLMEPPPVTVTLINEPPPTPPAPPAPVRAPRPPPPRAREKPQRPKRPARVKAVTRPVVARPKPAPPKVETFDADQAPSAGSGSELSEGQLVGAETAGSGGGGGGCDMAGRVQEALRKDRLVHAAVSGLGGKAMLVWDGDWVWMHGDVGRGLTAVRQAMAFEIAFAPEACRSKPMHGLVVFSVNASQGPVRLAVGLDRWRWSDLLGLRGQGLRH